MKNLSKEERLALTTALTSAISTMLKSFFSCQSILTSLITLYKKSKHLSKTLLQKETKLFGDMLGEKSDALIDVNECIG